MQVMKYNSQPPTMFQTLAEFVQDFGHSFADTRGITQNLPFSAGTDLAYERVATKAFNPRIFACRLGGELAPKQDLDPMACRLFHRSFTNYGLGYTFNGAAKEDLLTDTPTNERISRVFWTKSRRLQGREHKLHSVSAEGETLHILQMTLQLSEGEVEENLMANTLQEFRLSLHDPGELADLRQEYITLKAGKHHILKVEATSDAAAESSRSMDVQVNIIVTKWANECDQVAG